MTIDLTQYIRLAVFVTTLTSSIAFALGGLSTIPAILWLCLFAVPTIWFILLYQLTFFVACMVLDERRIAAGNRDCCRCFSPAEVAPEEEQHESTVDRIMETYAKRLLNPKVKGLVVFVFLAIAGVCAYSTSRLRQAFDFKDVLPGDSYITPFFDALNDYTDRSSVAPYAYFRDVDQSQVETRQAMQKYIDELVRDVEAVIEPPSFVWFQDFDLFVENNTDVQGLSFEDQLQEFIEDPVYKELYRDHLVIDNTTKQLVTSRCVVPFDNLDIENVKQQIEALHDQRDVSEAQEVNEGRKDFRFFTYEGRFVLVCMF